MPLLGNTRPYPIGQFVLPVPLILLHLREVRMHYLGTQARRSRACGKMRYLFKRNVIWLKATRFTARGKRHLLSHLTQHQKKKQEKSKTDEAFRRPTPAKLGDGDVRIIKN